MTATHETTSFELFQIAALAELLAGKLHAIHDKSQDGDCYSAAQVAELLHRNLQAVAERVGNAEYRAEYQAGA